MTTVTKADAPALIKKAQSHYDEADAILALNPTGEADTLDLDKVEKLMKDADALMARASKVDELNQRKNEAIEAAKVQQAALDEQGDDDELQTKLRAQGPTPDTDAFKQFMEMFARYAPGAELPQLAKARQQEQFGQFFRKVWLSENRNQDFEGLQWISGGDGKMSVFTAGKALAESVGATGGFLVPAEFRATLMQLVQDQAIVRPRADVIPMTRRELTLPVLDQSDTTAGQPSWFGSMTATWTEESASITADDPLFRQMTLVAHKLAVRTIASNELLDDAVISLGAFLTGPRGFPGVIAWVEDFVFLQGDGNGKPLGVINAPATISYARTQQNNVVYSDLTQMRQRFLPNGNGVWVMSISTMNELLQLQGPTGNPSFIWANAIDGAPGRLLGYPVVFTEKLPALASAGDVLLADFSHYVIGDRMATTIDTSIHERFSNDDTTWRAVHRVDGQPWLSTPVTLQDGTSQISPFVMLGAKTTS